MVCGPNHRVGTTETEQQNATHQECQDARKEIFVRLNNLKKGYAFSCTGCASENGKRKNLFKIQHL